MKKKLLIIGAGGHGKVVADIAIKMNRWKSISFLDSDETISQCLGLEVIGKPEDAIKFKEEADFFVAIGNNVVREKVMEFMLKKNMMMTTLIHPEAIIGVDVQVGNGTAIMAGVVINSSTSIGRGCIINTNSSIDHDNLIGSFVHISPGVNLAGTVIVGKRSWIGIGCTISNNIEISSDCIIGAGTVVIKDITESGTYVGLPARRID